MNQLVESYDNLDDYTISYYYDELGNLIGDGNGQYTYDYRGRLSFYSGNGIARYTYYVDGLRKSKSANNKTTYFIWLDGNMVYEFTGTESNTYTYGHRLLFSEEYKYILNAHGDVEVLIESDNTFVHRYRYDAFGNELNPSASDTNPFRYCAEYYDLETEQIYLRNRYYQPVTGRFTQLDPIRDGLNWYAYCVNNPVVFVDPSGLKITITGDNEYIQGVMDQLQKLTDDKLCYDYEKKQVVIETEYETDRHVGQELIRRLIGTNDTINIRYMNEYETPNQQVPRWNGNSDIIFDPYNASGDAIPELSVVDSTGNTYSENVELYISLGHELIHALHWSKGTFASEEVIVIEMNTGKSTSLEEVNTVGLNYVDIVKGIKYVSPNNFSETITENGLRAENNLSLRYSY